MEVIGLTAVFSSVHEYISHSIHSERRNLTVLKSLKLIFPVTVENFTKKTEESFIKFSAPKKRSQFSQKFILGLTAVFSNMIVLFGTNETRSNEIPFRSAFQSTIHNPPEPNLIVRLSYDSSLFMV